MKKNYNKLVRDNIPDIIKKNGAVPASRILDDAEFAAALNQKLIEETEEYLSSNEIEELADIYEVMLAILHNRGISMEEFERIRNQKAEERGGFKKKVFLISVDG